MPYDKFAREDSHGQRLEPGKPARLVLQGPARAAEHDGEHDAPVPGACGSTATSATTIRSSVGRRISITRPPRTLRRFELQSRSGRRATEDRRHRPSRRPSRCSKSWPTRHRARSFTNAPSRYAAAVSVSCASSSRRPAPAGGKSCRRGSPRTTTRTSPRAT